MKTLNPATRLWKIIPLRLLAISKEIYQLSRIQGKRQKTTVFIIGCQRSGTTLMLEIFERDLNTKVYGEFSKLSSSDAHHKIRLDPLDSVKKAIAKDRAPLVILKPLVETQNSLKLLDHFSGSKALWMYRHYKDVALSNLKQFGIENGINDLRPIVENNSRNWRCENVSESVRKTVLEHFSEGMNPYDAAALFWFVRNNLFFELGLDENPDVMMCKYEDLVMNPLETVNKVYEFIGHNFPGQRIVSEVHPLSLGKGKTVELSPEIDLLCKELLEKLDKACQI